MCAHSSATSRAAPASRQMTPLAGGLLVHLRLFFALRPVVTPAATFYSCLRVFVVNLWIVAADVRRQKIRQLTLAATLYSCVRVFVSLCEGILRVRGFRCHVGAKEHLPEGTNFAM